MSSKLRVCIALTLICLYAGNSSAARLNLFEWSAVAPIVASAEVLRNDGAFTEVQVLNVFRGTLEDSERIRVALKHANRDRSRNTDLQALKLVPGQAYVFLLQRAETKKKNKLPAYLLVRGVRGARELPAEGAPAFLDALREFIGIQDMRSEEMTWTRFGAMLEETNPILIETAIDQMLKFHRGEPDLLISLRPLLDHPRPDLRQRAVRLVAQILNQFPADEIPEPVSLRGELIGSARRDAEVGVRVAATEALAVIGDGSIEGILEEIARTDPDQAVRYAAQKSLLERRAPSAPALD